MSVHPKIAKLVTLINQAASGCEVINSLEIPLKTAANTIGRDPIAAQHVLSVATPYVRVLQAFMGMRKSPTTPFMLETKIPDLNNKLNNYIPPPFDTAQWRLLSHTAEMFTTMVQAGCDLTAATKIDLLGVMLCAALSCLRTPPRIPGSAGAGTAETEGSVDGKPQISQLLPVVECITTVLRSLLDIRTNLQEWSKAAMLKHLPSCAVELEHKLAAFVPALGLRSFVQDGEDADEEDDASDKEEEKGDETTDSKGVASSKPDLLVGGELAAVASGIAELAKFFLEDIRKAPDMRPASDIIEVSVDLGIIGYQLDPSEAAEWAGPFLAECVMAAVITATALTRKLPASQELVETCCLAGQKALAFMACSHIQGSSFKTGVSLLQACSTIYACTPYMLSTMKCWHTAVMEANEEDEGRVPRKDGRGRLVPAGQKARIKAATEADIAELPSPSNAMQLSGAPATSEPHAAYEFVVRGVTIRGGKAIIACIQDAITSMITAALHVHTAVKVVHGAHFVENEVPHVPGVWQLISADVLSLLDNVLVRLETIVPLQMVVLCAESAHAGSMWESNILRHAGNVCPFWALEATGRVAESSELRKFISRSPTLLGELIHAPMRVSYFTASPVDATIGACVDIVWETLSAGSVQLAKYSTTMQKVLLETLHNFAVCTFVAAKSASMEVTLDSAQTAKIIDALNTLIRGSKDAAIIQISLETLAIVLTSTLLLSVISLSSPRDKNAITTSLETLLGFSWERLCNVRHLEATISVWAPTLEALEDEEAITTEVSEFLTSSASLLRLECYCGILSRIVSRPETEAAGLKLSGEALAPYLRCLRESAGKPPLYDDDPQIVDLCKLMLLHVEELETRVSV